MPRNRLQTDTPIESLSILDENGRLDQELEPSIGKETLLDMYRSMLLGRRFDERMLDLQRQGRIGTFPPIKGQEAAHVAAVCQLAENDWFVPAFRETAAEILRGRSMESIILYYNGFNEGTIISPRQKDMPMAIPIATQIPQATGLGYAARYKKSGDIVMTFFGDGATSEGDFHEGLNCAAVFQTPVVFVCQNNQWAISIPLKKQTITDSIAQKAIAYGMPGILVDGNDVLAVYSAVSEAIERARTGGGPTLVECRTYRMMMHTTADDPSRYRTEEEVEYWRKRDPILRFEKYLIEKGLADSVSLEKMNSQILKQIQEAVDNAENQMENLSDTTDIFDHLYSDLPPHLLAQKQQVARRLMQKSKGGDS